MHRIHRPVLAFLIVFFGCTLTFADIRLPKIFSDNMVLQQGGPVRIWGTADAGEELTITLGEKSATTTAGEDGAWSVEVDAPPAGGPYELNVQGKESSVLFSEVLVGEVWLCSGQSNMQWSMAQSIDFESDEAKQKYFAGINMPNLRMFTVPANAIEEPVNDFTEAAVWEKCMPEKVAEFSAVAFFFAKSLKENEKLKDVPIGLIDSSWGGTPVEAWTSRDAMDTEESLAPLLQHWDDDKDNRSAHRPASLFNGMIAPVAPMSIRGVIWYQGESNVGRARQYKTIFGAMIKDWRTRFGKENMPFYFVQLAPFRYSDNDPRDLAELWDAQVQSLAIPNTAMVPSSDIGNNTDIHPKNKDVVGKRLANVALSQIYQVPDIEYSGPVFESGAAVEGGKFEITFAHNKGLTFRESKEAEATGFLICGEDKEFKPAKAEIVDGKVVVWCDTIAKPIAVRYLWDDTATATLFNDADLPALPFRSDDFELLSDGRDF